MPDSSERPLVTIGVGSYNNAQYVRETLDSIKAQTYPNIQLIVVDDCSPDNSVEIIEGWMKENPQVNGTLIKHETNQGVTTACNTMLAHARGKYFSFLASDDAYLPNKVEELSLIHIYKICSVKGMGIEFKPGAEPAATGAFCNLKPTAHVCFG